MRLVWAGSSGTPGCSGAPTPGDTGSLAGTGASYNANYGYGLMNRLTSTWLGGYTYSEPAHADAATGIGSVWSASYDAAGNMTCRALSAPASCGGSSSTGNLLSYGNEGRLTGWQNTSGCPTEMPPPAIVARAAAFWSLEVLHGGGLGACGAATAE